ncbi:putative tripartite motif-containing protein 75 [Dipodomys spectabilis]|uniref:putative tripartite motif-containing protein 75 n=1 Tax=Dipodomys spectabilis TaxID=105255 RepID=UPI001C534357|nr:putative tripartite motif-containing protein 75 [Dipodomys spectabilis]
MAMQAALAEFQVESKCPVCLGKLSDPVTIDCGHNFCRLCIRQCWAQMELLSCPVCRHRCMEGHFWSNHQMERMIEMTQQLLTGPSEERRLKEKPLCEQHWQVLVHFCEDDLQLLCQRCTQHPEHQGHCVRPIKEAAADHRLKLKTRITSLNDHVRHAQQALAAQYKKCVCLGQELEDQRQQLSTESTYLKMLVEQKHNAFLAKVQKQQEHIQQQLEANEMALNNHAYHVEVLCREIAEKSKMTETKLLTNIKSTLSKCESLAPPDLHTLSFRKDACAIALQLSALQRIRKNFRVEVTLDPQTAHPNLWVSKDKKSVAFMQTEPTEPLYPMHVMDYPSILGAARFTSGRHFWEVQVEDKDAWTVCSREWHAEPGGDPPGGLRSKCEAGGAVIDRR